MRVLKARAIHVQAFTAPTYMRGMRAGTRADAASTADQNGQKSAQTPSDTWLNKRTRMAHVARSRLHPTA